MTENEVIEKALKKIVDKRIAEAFRLASCLECVWQDSLYSVANKLDPPKPKIRRDEVVVLPNYIRHRLWEVTRDILEAAGEVYFAFADTESVYSVADGSVVCKQSELEP